MLVNPERKLWLCILFCYGTNIFFNPNVDTMLMIIDNKGDDELSVAPFPESLSLHTPTHYTPCCTILHSSPQPLPMMEVSELVNRTKRCSFQDIRLELPPNQQPLNSSANTIIGKLLSPKILSLPVIKEVVTKAWRPLYPLEVIKLDPNIFLFKFQHETDAQKTFLKRPWSIRGGHLILKKWIHVSPGKKWISLKPLYGFRFMGYHHSGFRKPTLEALAPWPVKS